MKTYNNSDQVRRPTMPNAPTFFSGRQHGKSLLAEKEAMKAWREGKRVVQIRNEGGEQRMMIWIPKETDDDAS